jgi:hypothetical protein
VVSLERLEEREASRGCVSFEHSDDRAIGLAGLRIFRCFEPELIVVVSDYR